MTGLLEVLAMHEHDAARAEEGGADRIMLVGSREGDGRAPEPRLVERVRAVTSLQLRPLLRLRDGFSTDGGEMARLQGLLDSYVLAGADGVVLGFLNGHAQVDRGVCQELIGESTFGWTYDVVDHALELDHAWEALVELPGLDQVLTAGSPLGLEKGLDEVLSRARQDPRIAALIIAGQGLAPEHVPWLVRAGVRSFHLAEQARPQGSFKSYVDAPLVHSWRNLLDEQIARTSGGK